MTLLAPLRGALLPLGQAAVSLPPPIGGVVGATMRISGDSLAGLANGASITSMPDLSGAGNVPTQATSGLRPVVATNQINGLPALSFDATKYLAAPHAANLSSRNTKTIAMVVSVTADAVNYGICGKGATDTDEESGIYRLSNGHYYFDVGSTSGPYSDIASFPTGWHVLVWHQNTAAGSTMIRVFKDGVVVAGSTSGSGLTPNVNAQPFYIGAVRGGTAMAKMMLAELCFWPLNASDPEIHAIAVELGAKYGITIT